MKQLATLCNIYVSHVAQIAKCLRDVCLRKHTDMLADMSTMFTTRRHVDDAYNTQTCRRCLQHAEMSTMCTTRRHVDDVYNTQTCRRCLQHADMSTMFTTRRHVDDVYNTQICRRCLQHADMSTTSLRVADIWGGYN